MKPVTAKLQNSPYLLDRSIEPRGTIDRAPKLIRNEENSLDILVKIIWEIMMTSRIH